MGGQRLSLSPMGLPREPAEGGPASPHPCTTLPSLPARLRELMPAVPGVARPPAHDWKALGDLRASAVPPLPPLQGFPTGLRAGCGTPARRAHPRHRPLGTLAGQGTGTAPRTPISSQSRRRGARLPGRHHGCLREGKGLGYQRRGCGQGDAPAGRAPKARLGGAGRGWASRGWGRFGEGEVELLNQQAGEISALP